MQQIFSDRISDVPKSFIREILKVAVQEDIISFAGGLPNRELFPIDELKKATEMVFGRAGTSAMQYSNSEGSEELRQFISDRYKQKFGFEIPLDHILITSGSQQGLDLLGKTFLNEGDEVIIEEPGYLGAIQAFSVYKTKFLPISINDTGMNLEKLEIVLNAHQPKLLYCVPNFQNPSGITYSHENRSAICKMLKDKDLYLVEDDPYGDLRYTGNQKKSFKQLIPEKTIMLGSFSKTVVPGFRLGWIVASPHLFDKLLIAKQASDLHTSIFTQTVLSEYLKLGGFDKHVEKIIAVYGRQCKAMITSIKNHFPKNVAFTHPQGGMFLWVTLPEGISSMKLFDIAIQNKVAFVPGHPFYIDQNDTNTLRLNFSSVDEETIKIGIQRLGESLKQLIP